MWGHTLWWSVTVSNSFAFFYVDWRVMCLTVSTWRSLRVTYLSLVVCPELCVGRSYFPWPQPQGPFIIFLFPFLRIWPGLNLFETGCYDLSKFLFLLFFFVDSNSNVLQFNQDCIPKMHMIIFFSLLLWYLLKKEKNLVQFCFHDNCTYLGWENSQPSI